MQLRRDACERRCWSVDCDMNMTFAPFVLTNGTASLRYISGIRQAACESRLSQFNGLNPVSERTADEKWYSDGTRKEADDIRSSNKHILLVALSKKATFVSVSFMGASFVETICKKWPTECLLLIRAQICTPSDDCP
eukprot:6178468-Pleurochrysis_carterae.AAC.1